MTHHRRDSPDVIQSERLSFLRERVNVFIRSTAMVFSVRRLVKRKLEGHSEVQKPCMHNNIDKIESRRLSN